MMKTLTMAVVLLVTTACSAVGQTSTPAPTEAPTTRTSSPESTRPPLPSTLTATASPEAPVANVCNNPQVDWSDLPAIAQSYGKAWNERDDADRAALLDGVMSENASYVDPTTDEPVVGAASIARMIGEFHDGFGDVYFEPLPWASSDQHHDRIRMRWRLCDPDGSVVWIGADFGTIENGRISAITGFFNEPAAFEVEDGCTGQSNSDWSRVPELVRDYGDAWMAEGNMDRRAMLDAIWAEDGYYVNPFVDAPVIGRAALTTHMDYAQESGQYIEVTAWTENNMHHGRLWIPWRQCCPTGATLVGGDELGEIDADGRLSRVTSFWNNEVQLPADVACD